MNNGKIIALSESHKKIFTTYKELKKMLPFGFLKTKISSNPKYEIPFQPLIKQIENEKNLSIETSPTLKTQHLLYNQNIYLYSNNTNGKKIISRLKQLQQFNKTAFTPTKTVKKIKNEELYKDSYDNEIINDYTNSAYDYKSFSINDVNMKKNVFLPSIIKRMKNNLPRNMRQKSGLSVQGIGVKSLKKLFNDNKNFSDDKIDEKFQHTRSDLGKCINSHKAHDLKLGFKMGDIKYVNNFYKWKSNLKKKYKKKGKELEDPVEIVGMKLIKKNTNNESISSNN